MMRPRILILETLVGIVVRTALVLSLFLLVAGHNAPGGGFAGGLVGGAALVLAFVGGGHEAVNRMVPLSPTTVLGVGLALAALTGMLGWVWGGGFLAMDFADLALPLVGTVKATSALLFDIGVYLVVVGMVAAVLESLGREAEG